MFEFFPFIFIVITDKLGLFCSDSSCYVFLCTFFFCIIIRYRTFILLFCTHIFYFSLKVLMHVIITYFSSKTINESVPLTSSWTKKTFHVPSPSSKGCLLPPDHTFSDTTWCLVLREYQIWLLTKQRKCTPYSTINTHKGVFGVFACIFLGSFFFTLKNMPPFPSQHLYVVNFPSPCMPESTFTSLSILNVEFKKFNRHLQTPVLLLRHILSIFKQFVSLTMSLEILSWSQSLWCFTMTGFVCLYSYLTGGSIFLSENNFPQFEVSAIWSEILINHFFPVIPFFSFSIRCIFVFWICLLRNWEKAVAPHSSTLAWKIPWTEEPGGLQSMGSRRVGHDWATSLSLFTFMHWRRKWQPTPVFLPGESQGQWSLVGCRLMGSHRVRHNWSNLAATAKLCFLMFSVFVLNSRKFLQLDLVVH